MTLLYSDKSTQESRIPTFFRLPRPSLVYKMLDVELNKVKGLDIFVHTNQIYQQHQRKQEEQQYRNNVFKVFTNNEDTLFQALRPLFIVGRLIGLVPFQGIFHGANGTELRFRWKSPAALYTIAIFSLMTFSFVINSVVSMRGANLTPSDLAWSANIAVFYGVAWFMYYFMLSRASRILTLFRRWRELFIFYDGTDRHLGRDVKLLTICVLMSCILEHSFAHLKFFPIVANAEKRLQSRPELLIRLQNASAWETYYWRSHPFFGDIVPYHPVSAFLVFIAAKYAILAWNFGDLFTAVVSRVISSRFRMIHDEALKDLTRTKGSASRDTEKWRQVARDHENLCDFVTEVDSCVNLLIFVQFGVNIYYFCLQLNLGLTPSPNTTTIASVYAVWSFSHLITRILIVAITASQVHVWAHRITAVLKKCPMECFTPEIDRAERNVRTSVIGLTGLGCFTITRTFILQIVNVVFTFEIVLLQTSPSTTNSSSTS